MEEIVLVGLLCVIVLIKLCGVSRKAERLVYRSFKVLLILAGLSGALYCLVTL